MHLSMIYATAVNEVLIMLYRILTENTPPGLTVRLAHTTSRARLGLLGCRRKRPTISPQWPRRYATPIALAVVLFAVWALYAGGVVRI